MNIESMLERFRDYFRKFAPEVDLRNPRFTEEEYTYKAERGRQMREWLGREALHQLVEQEDWDGICGRIFDSFYMKSGALAPWYEYQWARDMELEDKREFALALERFLHGEGPFADRLQQFSVRATEIYNRFRKQDAKWEKQYSAQRVTWPFVSYFHFMMWPDQGYVLVKPAPLRKASQLAGFDTQYEAQPNPTTYARVQEFYRALWPTVQGLGGRDWIDVQTFIHVAGEGFSTGPSPDAWAREIARWRADYLSPERIAARRQAEEQARSLLEESIGRFDKKTLQEFLTLVNTDLWEGRPNHTRFAPAFLGATAGSIIKSVREFNTWAGRLWNAAASDLNSLLDSFWQQKSVPGAGTSLPTLLLYLRDPGRYNIWLPKMADGLEQLTGSPVDRRCGGPAYVSYNDAVKQVRKRYNLQPQETDVILVLASKSGPPAPPPLLPALPDILRYIADSEYVFSPAIASNYHLALLTKPLVILTGLSGTGKTLLTRLYADAAHGIAQGEDNPYYAIVAVRPDWTDSHALLGYYNPLTRTYEAPLFLRHMLKAAADPERAYFVCLDEMNLARVEHYFADFLSALESGEEVALHACDGQCVATRSGEGIPLLLAEDEFDGPGYEKDGVLYVPPAVHIPKNLFISGTVNVDETTHAFSDKVLDRANSIELDRVDLEEYAARFRGLGEDYAALADEAMPLLGQIHQLLEPCYLHFGYRTLDEVLAYLRHNRQQTEALSPAEALDNQIMQKILPKLRGDERIREPMERLRVLLEKELGAESRSVRKLVWMLKELESFGSTHFWR